MEVPWYSIGRCILEISRSSGIPHRDISSLSKSSWDAVGSFDAPSWKCTSTQQGDTSWGSLRAQPSPKTRSFHFLHPKQYGAFPRRTVLPYPYSEILSGYEEDFSSIRDDFKAWVKSDPETILKRHVVDSKGIYLAYREAPARRQSPSSSAYHFDNNMPNRSAEQTRLSVYNSNPGPRRGKTGALESHIAAK